MKSSALLKKPLAFLKKINHVCLWLARIGENTKKMFESINISYIGILQHHMYSHDYLVAHSVYIYLYMCAC